MYPATIVYVVGGFMSVVGAITLVAGATWFAQWLQSQNQSIFQNQSVKNLGGGRVYVELSALKQDGMGYFIPGYGRILQTEEAMEPLQRPEVKRWKGKVAFVCYAQTESAENAREYVIGDIVPL